MQGQPAQRANEAPQNAAVALAVLVLFAAPYLAISGHSPARYLIPDLAILGVVVLRFRGSSMRQMGLAVSPLHLCAAVIIFAVGVFLAQAIVGQISGNRDIEIVGPRYLFSLSQVLHQEIVLRGLLLGALARRFPSPMVVAISAAMIFAGFHPLLFWLKSDLVLPLTSIATLFCFGLATNILFIRFGHIAFSFAAHAAWNLARFGDGYITHGHSVSEAQTFAVFEASGHALGAAVGLLVISAVVAAKRTPDD